MRYWQKINRIYHYTPEVTRESHPSVHDLQSTTRIPLSLPESSDDYFWPDCKAIPAYGLMMSVCLSVCPSVRLSTFWLLAGLQSNSGLSIDDVRLSVCPSVRLSTFWWTSGFKFVLGRIYQYRLDTLHGNRPWIDLLNCDLSLWPWPSLFLFKVT